MFQVALGGYSLTSVGAFFDDVPIYSEPGFTIMSPLEIEVSKCDIFYILVRKRSDTSGSQFESLTVSNLTATVKDATNGVDIPSRLTVNDIYGIWDSDPSVFFPLVLKIDNNINVDNINSRVRILDCYISDNTDNEFISFRTTINEDDNFFHYMPFYTSELKNRYSNTAIGRQAYFKVKNSTDGYMLFSPYAYLVEVEKDDINVSFSYPLESIYYKRQDTYNNEGFYFEISAYSHSFVEEGVSLINVPNYQKAAVLHVDSYLYTKLVELGDNAFVDISIQGILSGIIDTFRIFLTRK